MSSVALAVQKAIKDALASALSGVAAVYDYVPQGAAYPYVTIDRMDAVTDDFLASRKDERFVYLNVWSQYRGQKEVLEILSEMESALHQQRLFLQAGRSIACDVIRQNTRREPDNLTFMGNMTVRVRTEQ